MASSRSRRPEALVERVSSRIVPLLEEAEEGVLLAFSGGLDSTVLLHVLKELSGRLPFSLRACHVHHGLSVFADEWSAHCAQVCEALSVPLQILRVEVERQSGFGLEASAREARYEGLRADWSGWILLAHHADDQAETLLFRLVRGAGVHGAACMRETDFVRKLARPLLAESRACLEAYAKAHGLSWVEDDSNPDERYSRNFLRHRVMAPLLARFPSVADNMARSAALFEEADGLLEELARIDEERVAPGQPGSRSRLRELSSGRARNLLRFWLHRGNSLLPELARLEEGLRQLCGESPVRWAFGNSALCAYRDRLWVESAKLPEVLPLVWKGEPVLPWGGGSVRFPSSLPGDRELRLETCRPGMHWSLAANRPRRAFKLLCQDVGIPPWWRDRLPCIWAGEALQWVGGFGRDGDFAWEDSSFPIR